MRFRVIVAGFLTVATASHAVAGWRIGDNGGGEVGRYLQEFISMRDSGEAVVIDGTCLSACTLVLAFIPRERICVTPRAWLGFHAAWTPDPIGRPIASQWGTRTLVALYPDWVREWITRSGGLSNRTLYLGGSELATMLSTCR
jgi:hypothetical protein